MIGVADGGTIQVADTVTVPKNFIWKNHKKEVTITGVTLDFTGLSNVEIGDDVTFDEITLTFTAGDNLFANGHAVTIGSNVDMTNNISLYGGGNGEDSVVDSTNLTVLSGTYSRIYGGSLEGTVKGSTNLYIGGNVNDEENASAHANTYRIYAGGNNDTVGSTNCTFTGSAQANYLFGGSYGDDAKVNGTTNLAFEGGAVYGIYGGNESSATLSGTKVTMTGGMVAQVFGANQSTSMTGNVDLQLLGGTITRRIYGGCYNEYGTTSFSSSNYVTGTIALTLGENLEINLQDPDSLGDLAVYARSRHNQVSSNEKSIIYYENATAQTKHKDSLGAQDTGAKMIMKVSLLSSKLVSACDNSYVLN